MQYRLIKSEPYKYSRQQFLQDKKTTRDGVRSYEARNNLNAMHVGDLCLRYHSNEGKEIVGIAEVVQKAYPDPTALSEKGDWVAVDIIPKISLKRPVALEQIKTESQLINMCLLKRQRLSVACVTKEEFDYIKKLAK